MPVREMEHESTPSPLGQCISAECGVQAQDNPMKGGRDRQGGEKRATGMIRTYTSRVNVFRMNLRRIEGETERWDGRSATKRSSTKERDDTKSRNESCNDQTASVNPQLNSENKMTANGMCCPGVDRR